MPNRCPKCDVCGFRHREGNCRGPRPKVGSGGKSALNAIECQSRGILVQDLARFFEERGVTVYADPFSTRALAIAERAILRADTLGVEHYGIAPPIREDARDFYQEMIDELYDVVFYAARQIARLEDLRERVTP